MVSIHPITSTLVVFFLSLISLSYGLEYQHRWLDTDLGAVILINSFEPTTHTVGIVFHSYFPSTSQFSTTPQCLLTYRTTAQDDLITVSPANPPVYTEVDQTYGQFRITLTISIPQAGSNTIESAQCTYFSNTRGLQTITVSENSVQKPTHAYLTPFQGKRIDEPADDIPIRTQAEDTALILHIRDIEFLTNRFTTAKIRIDIIPKTPMDSFGFSSMSWYNHESKQTEDVNVYDLRVANGMVSIAFPDPLEKALQFYETPPSLQLGLFLLAQSTETRYLVDVVYTLVNSDDGSVLSSEPIPAYFSPDEIVNLSSITRVPITYDIDYMPPSNTDHMESLYTFDITPEVNDLTFILSRNIWRTHVFDCYPENTSLVRITERSTNSFPLSIKFEHLTQTPQVRKVMCRGLINPNALTLTPTLASPLDGLEYSANGRTFSSPPLYTRTGTFTFDQEPNKFFSTTYPVRFGDNNNSIIWEHTLYDPGYVQNSREYELRIRPNIEIPLKYLSNRVRCVEYIDNQVNLSQPTEISIDQSSPWELINTTQGQWNVKRITVNADELKLNHCINLAILFEFEIFYSKIPSLTTFEDFTLLSGPPGSNTVSISDINDAHFLFKSTIDNNVFVSTSPEQSDEVNLTPFYPFPRQIDYIEMSEPRSLPRIPFALGNVLYSAKLYIENDLHVTIPQNLDDKYQWKTSNQYIYPGVPLHISLPIQFSFAPHNPVMISDTAKTNLEVISETNDTTQTIRTKSQIDMSIQSYEPTLFEISFVGQLSTELSTMMLNIDWVGPQQQFKLPLRLSPLSQFTNIPHAFVQLSFQDTFTSPLQPVPTVYTRVHYMLDDYADETYLPKDIPVVLAGKTILNVDITEYSSDLTFSYDLVYYPRTAVTPQVIYDQIPVDILKGFVPGSVIPDTTPLYTKASLVVHQSYGDTITLYYTAPFIILPKCFSYPTFPQHINYPSAYTADNIFHCPCSSEDGESDPLLCTMPNETTLPPPIPTPPTPLKTICDYCNQPHTQECDENSQKPTCQCNDGWGGVRCDVAETCESASAQGCVNGGYFSPASTDSTKCNTNDNCTCYDNWIGKKCQVCSLHCYNNGVVYRNCDKCGCQAGFAGTYCQCSAKVGTITINASNSVLKNTRGILGLDLHGNDNNQVTTWTKKFTAKSISTAFLSHDESTLLSMGESIHKDIFQVLIGSNDNGNQNDFELTITPSLSSDESHRTEFKIAIKFNCPEHNPNINSSQFNTKWSQLVDKFLSLNSIQTYFGPGSTIEAGQPVDTDPTLPADGEEYVPIEEDSDLDTNYAYIMIPASFTTIAFVIVVILHHWK